MIKYSSIIIVLFVAKTTTCHKQTTALLPSCIEHKIDSLKAQPKTNPPAEVQQYTYHGKTVYLFSAPCCDQFSALYDEGCNYLCAPSGGITGKGDGKCNDFATTAQLVKVIWKDER